MFLQLAHTKKDFFQQSRRLALECYSITKELSSNEKFVMVQQIRRAALSVHLNIAEGCSRKSLAERKRFFEIARGSLIEIDAAIDIACELKYCERKSFEHLGTIIISCFKQFTGLISNQ